jgi:hypothetical protein
LPGDFRKVILFALILVLGQLVHTLETVSGQIGIAKIADSLAEMKNGGDQQIRQFPPAEIGFSARCHKNS